MKPIQIGKLNKFLLDLLGPNFKLGNLAIELVLNGSPKFISFSKHSSSSQGVCDRLHVIVLLAVVSVPRLFWKRPGLFNRDNFGSGK